MEIHTKQDTCKIVIWLIESNDVVVDLYDVLCIRIYKKHYSKIIKNQI